MFGSTLALAGLIRDFRLNKQVSCGGPASCAICLGALRYVFADWTESQRSAIAQDLQELYETPMSMCQLRSLFGMYPQLDTFSAAFDQSIHKRAIKRTLGQKAPPV
jgi:hypothetical protein